MSVPLFVTIERPYELCPARHTHFPTQRLRLLRLHTRKDDFLPLPDLPTNRRSLNLATWFFMTAELFLNSPQKFSSLPALTVTMVPSLISSSATTLKDMGKDLLERQWLGNAVHRMLGAPVFTSSPGCSPPPPIPPMLATSVMSPALRHATVIRARGSAAPA